LAILLVAHLLGTGPLIVTQEQHAACKRGNAQAGHNKEKEQFAHLECPEGEGAPGLQRAKLPVLQVFNMTGS
jgi:hypothetical protein